MTGCSGNAALAPGLSRLFTELTGLRFDVLSAPAPGLQWDTGRLIAGCRDHARRWRYANGGAHCAACARAHLRRALASGQLGHRFCGPCGVSTYLLPVVGDCEPVLVMALRAIPRGGRRPRHDSTGPTHPDREFDRCVRLLRVMARDTALRLAAGPRATEVARLKQAVASHEREEARLRRSLARVVPSIRRSPASSADATRARRVVRLLLERMQREFTQRLVLAHMAEEFGMNASYLSSVFSREVGMSFKPYLTALRLQRAQELLHDPLRRVSDVAGGVGYASADRFRAAYRAWAGLSPTRWRAALTLGSEP